MPRVKKIEMAKELYTKNHNLPRKQLIKLFEKELDMSNNSARTYINKCANSLNSKLNLPPIASRKLDRSKLKKYQAQKIFNTNPHLSRAELISKIHLEVGLGMDSASTYCSIFAKEYSDSIPHKAIVKK